VKKLLCLFVLFGLFASIGCGGSTSSPPKSNPPASSPPKTGGT